MKAENGAPCSPKHAKKRLFIDSLKRGIGLHSSSSKQLTEAAAITCVKLCKASSYINLKDSYNVAFTLVQSIVMDLKVIFN